MSQQVRVERLLEFIGDASQEPNVRGDFGSERVSANYEFTELRVTAPLITSADSAAAAGATATAIAAADATASGASYVQAEAQSTVTLANELKVDYTALLADVADIRTKYAAVVTLANELKADYNTMAVNQYTPFVDTTSTVVAGSGGTVLTTAATDTKTCTQTQGGIWWYPNKAATVEMKFRIDVITNVAIFAGFSDAVSEASGLLPHGIVTAVHTATAADSVGFLFDTRQSLSYFNIVNSLAAGAVKAFTQLASTYVPVAATDITIRVALDTSGNARYYWNGTEVGYKATAVTAATPLIPFFGIRNNSGTAHVATLRRVRCWQN